MKSNLLFLGTFSVDTTVSGEKYVINNLLQRLSSHFNIEFLSLVDSDKIYKEVSVSPNFKNIQIPQNTKQAKIQWDEERKNETNLFGVIQINSWKYNTDFLKHVKQSILKSDMIILEQPYLANLVKSLDPKIPIIYHANNLETNQKKPILTFELLNDVCDVEKTACAISSQIWASSELEKNQFTKIHDISQDKIKMLPHGVDLSSPHLISRSLHAEIKSKFKDIVDKTIFVFTGSWHPPNLESLEFIISDLSAIDKNFLYFIVGSVSDYYLHVHPKKMIPENVIFFGSITEKEKFDVYKLTDFAINPMFSGAETNLKILEYMATGIPIISTEFGARGINFSKETMICKKDEFVSCIKNIQNNNYENNPSITENYDIVCSQYDYDLLAKKCINFLIELLSPDLLDLNLVFDNVISELINMHIVADDDINSTLAHEIKSMV